MKKEGRAGHFAVIGNLHHRALPFLSWFVLLMALLILPIFGLNKATAEIMGQRVFNLEDRTACQTSIEDIRWLHRIWPEENLTPKPHRSEILSDNQIHAKVEDSQRMASALKNIYDIEITEAMLQAELNRMARNTKDPEMLQEFFDALDNDPVTISECLARPGLVEKKLYQNYVWDTRQHGALSVKAEQALVHAGAGNLLPESGGREFLIAYVRKEDGIKEKPALAYSDDFRRIELVAEDFERETARFNDDLAHPGLPQVAPVLRETETAFVYEEVLSRSAHRLEVRGLVWQKVGFGDWWQQQREQMDIAAPQVNTARLELPVITVTKQVDSTTSISADSWLATRIPEAREYHTAVWTGSEMIIWGGRGIGPYPSLLTSGSRYYPATDSWQATAITAAPSDRSWYTVVWTGTEMIVWGGDDGSNFPDAGGRYDPATNSWRATTTTGAPSGRSYHTAVWTGSEMIVWGGIGVSYTVTGGRYDPATDSWQATATTGAPAIRQAHTAVWTSNEMIIWGGYSGSLKREVGGRYDPVADSWRATTTTGMPSARSGHTAVWTDSEMIVWGGNDADGRANTGSRYDPVTDSWRATTTTGGPSARNYHTAVWTGSEMIVWGGIDNSGFGNDRQDSGGRYDPSTDNWQATSTMGVPSGRAGHTAVWADSEMIIWGGSIYQRTNTGGRYDPSADSWQATATSEVEPSTRYDHTAVWTGSEMIIWGGSNNYLDTGGRYDPATDSWQATTTTGAPSGRYDHTAVWTGSKMIIWGGYDGSRANTGGRYDPATDSWQATTTTGAPRERYDHTAVWTGSEMIVWGGSDSNTGGRYDPATDSWQVTTTAGAPTERKSHTAVWTGSEMIIWSGYDGTVTNTGGRYNPATNSWQATTTTSAPGGRRLGAVVWTGSEMIVWGGYDSTVNVTNTGGRYDPVADSWQATTTTDGPSARYNLTAVWADSEMIVWGGHDGGIANVNTGGRYDPATDSWQATTTEGAPYARQQHTAIWADSEMIVWGGHPGFEGVRMYYPYGAAYYTVGGTVNGLAPDNGVVLQNNGGDDLTVNADGTITFATTLDDGDAYEVTVLTQPTDPVQTCTVSNGSGTLAGADVTNVSVTCVTWVEEIFLNGFEE